MSEFRKLVGARIAQTGESWATAVREVRAQTTRALWEPGNPIPIAVAADWALAADWAPMRDGLYANEALGIFTTVWIDDGFRHVSFDLMEGRWRRDRLFDAATEWIAKGTPINLRLDISPDRGASPRFVHAVDGSVFAGSVPLLEDNVNLSPALCTSNLWDDMLRRFIAFRCRPENRSPERFEALNASLDEHLSKAAN